MDPHGETLSTWFKRPFNSQACRCVVLIAGGNLKKHSVCSSVSRLLLVWRGSVRERRGLSFIFKFQEEFHHRSDLS